MKDGHLGIIIIVILILLILIRHKWNLLFGKRRFPGERIHSFVASWPTGSPMEASRKIIIDKLRAITQQIALRPPSIREVSLRTRWPGLNQERAFIEIKRRLGWGDHRIYVYLAGTPTMLYVNWTSYYVGDFKWTHLNPFTLFSIAMVLFGVRPRDFAAYYQKPEVGVQGTIHQKIVNPIPDPWVLFGVRNLRDENEDDDIEMLEWMTQVALDQTRDELIGGRA